MHAAIHFPGRPHTRHIVVRQDDVRFIKFRADYALYKTTKLMGELGDGRPLR